MNSSLSIFSSSRNSRLWAQEGSRHLVFAMVQEPYIQHPLKEGPFDLTIRDMGSEFRYILGKVLVCVLHLNLIKNMFNTCILTHTHTHTHTHQHTSKHTTWHHSSLNTYISTFKQKRAKPKCICETLACKTLSYILKQGTNPNMVARHHDNYKII